MSDPVDSPFQVGTSVALIHTKHNLGDSVTRWVVSKVRKDGRFYISFREPDGSERQSDTMWTPEPNKSSARCRNQNSHSISWLEVWSHSHDEAVKEQRLVAAAYVDKEDIITWLKSLDVKNPIDRGILMRLKRSWVNNT